MKTNSLHENEVEYKEIFKKISTGENPLPQCQVKTFHKTRQLLSFSPLDGRSQTKALLQRKSIFFQS